MTIYDKHGDPFLEITPDDTSYRHREVMGDDTLVLKFSSPVHVEIPVGSTCEFGGETYTLARPEALTMRHSRDFEYTVTMEGPQYRAGMWKFRDLSDGRLKFSLTAKPEEHLKLLIGNLNDREGSEVWSAGDCIDGAEACVGYDHVYCSEALALMAEAFGTEWEIDGAAHTVSLGKVEHDRDNPISLSYGKGCGFLPDVGRSNSSDTPPCEILYAQGGGDNIDAGKYPQDLHRDDDDPATGEPYPGDGTGNGQNTHSSVLLLPPGRVIGYDGGEFLYEGDEGWDGAGVRHYVVDEKGYSIRRDPDEKALDTMAEDSLDCSDIYPKRVGTVAEVVAVEGKDDDGNGTTFYDFTDPGIDFDYNDYMVGTGPLTVIFQSGNLAGKEFDVTYVHEAADGKEARRFEVSQQEIDGVIMPQGPGEAFGINPGDTYAVFGCMLPDEYICDDAAHSGAEWDMLRQCAAYMYDHEQENHTITGKMDAIWARERWGDIGDRVRPGCFVRFADAQWQVEWLLIRITGVKDYLNSPHGPELELSNETKGTGLMMMVAKLAADAVKTADAVKDSAARSARLVTAAKEDLTASVEKVEAELDTSVATLRDDMDASVARIDSDVAEVRGAVTTVEGAVTTLEGEMSDIDGRVGSIVDSAVAEAKGELEAYTDSAVKGATEELEGSIGTLVDSAVSGVKAEIEGDMTAYTDSAVSKVEGDLRESIADVDATLTDSISKVSDKVDTVESDLSTSISKVADDATAYTDSAVGKVSDELNASIIKVSDDLTASITKVESDLSTSISKVADDATAYTDSAVGKVSDELNASIIKVSDDLTASITKVESDLNDSIIAVSDKVDAVGSDLKLMIDNVEQELVADSSNLYGMVSTVEKGLEEAQSTVAGLSEDVSQVKSDVEALGTDYTSLSGTVTDLGSSLSSLSDTVTDINAEVFGGTKSDGRTIVMRSISSRLTDAESDVSSLNVDVSSLGTDVSAVIDTINGTDDVTGIIPVVTALQDAVDKLNAAVAALDSSYKGGDTGGKLNPVTPGMNG